jgi:cold shock CspA family protein
VGLTEGAPFPESIRFWERRVSSFRQRHTSDADTRHLTFFHEDTKMTGTILRIRDDRGFGFLRDNEDGYEHFFHCSACITPWENLLIGQTVTFDFGQTRKGIAAINVTVIG